MPKERIRRSTEHGPGLAVAAVRDRRRDNGLDDLVRSIRACRVCRDQPQGAVLPHEPRPVLRVSSTATICIAGQAPGTRVHASGTPFSDSSGDRLRDWMGIGSDAFYDVSRIAIIPMGFCFPGQDRRGADRPPRIECAATWRTRLFAALPRVKFVLAVGRYAHAWHLGPLARSTLTETVAAWRQILTATTAPVVMPLPHPSWRNNAWLKRNPWFEEELLPVLRAEVGRRLRETH